MHVDFQNILALTLVVACACWASWQGFKSLAGKKSKLGSCCAKGCSAEPAKPTEKIQFIPLSALSDRAKRESSRNSDVRIS